jgi:hypothetical protein
MGMSETEATRSTCHPSYLAATLTGAPHRPAPPPDQHLRRNRLGGGDSLADPDQAARLISRRSVAVSG